MSGEPFENENYGKYISVVKTSDMINFANPVFDKVIKSNIEKKVEVIYRYETERLLNIAPYVSEKIDVSKIDIQDYVSTDNMLQNREGVIPYDGVPNIDRGTKYKIGDVLVSNIRPYLKKIWLASKNGGCSNDVLVFRVKDNNKINNKFLFEILSQDLFFDYMMAGTKGMKMPRGDKDSIPNFSIPLPPLDVQAQIVSECEAIDNEFENSKKTIEESKAKIEEIMSNVEGEKRKIKEVFSLSSGKALPAHSRVDGEYAVYGGNGITGYHNSYNVEKPTIVIGRVGEYCGSVYITNPKSWITDNALYVTNFLIDINIKYLCEVLVLANLNQYANRKSQPNISQTGIAYVEIPVPSLPEQERIVKLVEAEEKKINDAKAIMASVKERKQAVLDKYLK